MKRSLTDRLMGRFKVKVELGVEVDYVPQTNDNPKTDYRCFRMCDVFYATDQEMLENEEWLLTGATRFSEVGQKQVIMLDPKAWRALNRNLSTLVK
ncbi:hypothetical protein LC593_21270 [Nostoc sp. CHAB 5844]|nr:hypothetical protein [Nostoc sp. CHAB 5844]